MNEAHFSKEYSVRKLEQEDIPAIYDLCKGNTLYYDFCPPYVTQESIMENMQETPPNISMDDKYYVGYFTKRNLVAVMDLIDGYPEENIAFIGFFMVDVSVHKRGVGTRILTELIDYLSAMEYKTIRLAWVKGNPQAEHFWIKNGFQVIKETTSSAAECVILAERSI